MLDLAAMFGYGWVFLPHLLIPISSCWRRDYRIWFSQTNGRFARQKWTCLPNPPGGCQPSQNNIWWKPEAGEYRLIVYLLWFYVGVRCVFLGLGFHSFHLMFGLDEVWWWLEFFSGLPSVSAPALLWWHSHHLLMSGTPRWRLSGSSDSGAWQRWFQPDFRSTVKPWNKRWLLVGMGQNLWYQLRIDSQ